MAGSVELTSVTCVTAKLPVQLVEIGFVGSPPARAVRNAVGVSHVEVTGSILRCVVTGSFQPFLEALRGHEVTTFQSTAIHGGQE